MTRNSIYALSKVPDLLATVGVSGVLTLMLSTGSVAATPSFSRAGATPTDGPTAEQVYEALNADPTDYFRHVDVQVRHGVVTLSGYVWSTPALYRAEKITTGIPGVTRVVDQLELERDGIEPYA
jgi:osmotically-inducible protein OsmY